MKVNIYESFYKDQKCMVLEGERLMVKVLPNVGGKIQSIFDKTGNKEYLYQAQGKEFRMPKYDTLFEDGEFSGFDDMFPSISECFYPTWPWYGIKVPDHGEVWSIPWECRNEHDYLFAYVYGVRFPYKLEKVIELKNHNILRVSYRAINLSSFDFEFIWAAHPLFNCSRDMVIILPESVGNIINAYGGRERLSDYGTVHQWPKTCTSKGEVYDLSRICPEDSRTCEKYYIMGKMAEGWCALHDTKSGDVVALSYPAGKVPYLGMWINEGGYHGQYNVALEPCTGILDRVDTAKQWNRVGVLKARSEFSWYINITIDSVNSINYVDNDGLIK